MKKQTMIMWNHLQYSDQVKAMNLIADLIEQQSDTMMRTALAAAITELEIWSNTPLDLGGLVHDEPQEENSSIEDEEPPTIH